MNICAGNTAVFRRRGRNCKVEAIERSFAIIVRFEMRSGSTRGDIERYITKQTLRVLDDSAPNGTEVVCSTLIHVIAAIKLRERECRLIQLVRMLTFTHFHTHSLHVIIITHQI